MIKNCFCLEVLNLDNNYRYITLMFNSRKELDRADDLIKKFDKDYYESKEFKGNYYDALIKLLNKNNIDATEVEHYTTYIR